MVLKKKIQNKKHKVFVQKALELGKITSLVGQTRKGA